MDAYPFAVTAAAVMGAAAGWHADRLLHRYDPVRYSASTARTTWLALLGAGSCAFVAARVGVVWAAPATVLLAAVAIPLGAVDIAVQRVPRVVVTAAGLVSAGLLVAAAMLEAEPQRLLTAAAGAAGLWLGFTLLAVCRAMCAGDARLAALLGMQLGWLGAGSRWDDAGVRTCRRVRDGLGGQSWHAARRPHSVCPVHADWRLAPDHAAGVMMVWPGEVNP